MKIFFYSSKNKKKVIGHQEQRKNYKYWMPKIAIKNNFNRPEKYNFKSMNLNSFSGDSNISHLVNLSENIQPVQTEKRMMVLRQCHLGCVILTELSIH